MVKKRVSNLKSIKRSTILLWILCSAWVACLVVFWQGGFLGNWLLEDIAPKYLPADLDDGFFVTKVVVEDQPIIPRRGLRISVSPQQLRNLLRKSSPLFTIIPPGIITDDVVVHGKWVPEKAEEAYSVPITINCSEDSGDRPRIAFRYPVKDLNALLQVEMKEDWRDEDEYFLGTYSKEQRIWFDSLSVKSIGRETEIYDAPILFTIMASGRLRYNVKDGPIGARITAKIKKLNGTVTLIPEKHSKGVGFKYSLKVDDLDMSVKKMAPWLEKKFARDIKDSIERSLNKRKRRREFAKMRIPYWFPLDIDIDIELTEYEI